MRCLGVGLEIPCSKRGISFLSPEQSKTRMSFLKIIQHIVVLIYVGDCLCELLLRCVSDWFPVLYAHV